MRSHFRIVLGSVVGISIVMILILGFHLGGPYIVKIGSFLPLSSGLITGFTVLISVRMPARREENIEPWLRRERLAWTLIGCAFIPWAIGESIWRYYVAHGQNPFPSLSDLGYSCTFPLIFAGLLLQPSSKSSQKRIFLILDSLITMGALLSIAWFLLLGPLAQTPAETPLAKFLGLYYPLADVIELSCIAFLLLRRSDSIYQIPARRISLLVFGLGLSISACSDFLFNILNNIGIYQDGSWIDVGWPLGMLMIGMAAYLRRFLPGSTARNNTEEYKEDDTKRLPFGLAQLLPYLLLVILFVVLGFNALSSDKTQQSIRPVLLVATLIVIGLVIVRQIMTMQENDLLMKEQVDTLKKLEKVHHDVKSRKAELEAGITHLKEVQTRLANGDVRARAQIMGGDLWPLATGLNLMADRMMRSEHNQRYAHKLVKAVGDLTMTLEGRSSRLPLVLPASCLDVPELHHLLTVLGLRPSIGATPSTPTPLPPTTFQQRQQPSASSVTQNNFPRSPQRATP
jgi:hypothetical protein